MISKLISDFFKYIIYVFAFQLFSGACTIVALSSFGIYSDLTLPNAMVTGNQWCLLGIVIYFAVHLPNFFDPKE